MRGADVGWNPRWPIFHERSGTRDEHEEHEGKNKENTRGNTREITQPTRSGYTYARSSKHKEIHDSNPTKDDTSGGSSSP